MIERVLLDSAEPPGGGMEFRLYQHDKDFMILVGNEELMSSRRHASEEALARLATERVGKRKQARILIGGLGMGFTLRAALDGLGPKATVVVSEIVPAVVKWNRGLLVSLADNPLGDKRVDLREVDATKIIKKAKWDYDAILLDVDNGPNAFSCSNNDWFYGVSGLYAARTALRAKGVLAVWSVARDDEFTQRLEHVGFKVDEIRVRACPGGKGPKHHIWLAEKK